MKMAFTTIVVFITGAGFLRATGQDIEITDLERTPAQSVHRVRVRTQEIPHYHAWHDSTVMLERGGGILYLNGTAYPLKPGDRIRIPRNVPHYFVHTASAPFSEALVVFTPPYDGKDRVPVDANVVQTPGWRTRLARAMERVLQLLKGSFPFAR